MTARVSPRIDIVFKKLFGVEENKGLLISLINSIVSQEDQVADLVLLNPYNLQNFKDDKLSILDIKAKGLDGKQFNIEIQITDEADYDKRALYYWGKLYTDQLKSSDDYSKLCKTIGIHILNFTSITDSDKYHHCFHLVDEKTGMRYFKDIELHTIELNKFTKNLDDDLNSLVAKIKDSLDVWVAFLTKYDLLDPTNLPKELDDDKLKIALNVLEVMNFNKRERDSYEDSLNWFRIESGIFRKMEEKAREKFSEEYIAIGEARGEEKKAIEVAKNLLGCGLSIDIIVKSTGLTVAQIEKLK